MLREFQSGNLQMQRDERSNPEHSRSYGMQDFRRILDFSSNVSCRIERLAGVKTGVESYAQLHAALALPKSPQPRDADMAVRALNRNHS